MSIKWRVLIVASVIAGIILWWFLHSQSHKKTDGIIKVGVLHSLTGLMAVTEGPMIDAVNLAIDEINENGGVLGKKLVPIIVDAQSDWPTYAREAERLITEEKVLVIFGGYTSASRKMVKTVVEKFNNLLFYPTQYEGLETSKNIIYMGSTANQQAIPAVTWSLQNLGRRVFLVGSDYIYQHAINSIIKMLLTARNGTLVGEEYISFTQQSVDPIIEKIIKAKPDVIINNIVGEENSRFFKTLRKAGISAEKIPTVSLTISETEIASLNINEMIGDYGVQNYFQSLDTPANNSFVEKFKKKFGAHRTISSSMQNAYAGIYFWKNAVEKAQTTDTDAVREQLRGAVLSAPEGIISIDGKTLDTWKPVLIGKIFPNKQFGIVWNSVSTIAPLKYPPLMTKEHWDSLLEYYYTKWGNQWWR
jgi:urea transport system substrate-binding protein